MTQFGDVALPDAAPIAEPQYSRAYERFVRTDDDTIGLIAYALFKASIREEAIDGVAQQRASRAPVPAMVDAFRQAAESRVSEIISGAIIQATPDIQASSAVTAITAAQAATLAATDTAERNLKGHMDRRTGFWQAVGISFVGWLLTLGVTAIIIFLAGRPTVEDRIKKAVTAQTSAAAVENKAD